MTRYTGIVLSPGFARGQAWVLSPILDRVVPRYDLEPDGWEDELARFESAAKCCRCELEALKLKLASEVEGAEIAVLDAHLAMLEDPVFVSNVRSRIRDQLVNAEQAVSDEIDVTAALFEQLNNEYLRERSRDLCDVGQQLVDALTREGREEEVVEIPFKSILVAHELMPSQAAGIDRRRVVGIITEAGGTSSHAAILARSLGVPFISGLTGIVRRIPHRASLLVNGEDGEVVVQPSASESRGFNARKTDYDRFLARARKEEKEPSQTLDGVPITLMGNVASAADADAVIDHHLSGIGLLRTEFLFMTAEVAPKISAQARAYRRIVGRVGELPVTIRCMDLGADKIPRFLSRGWGQNREDVPSARGLRFALEHPALLLDQCRAIMRVAGGGHVSILLPMVAGLDDFERAKRLICEAAEKEGLACPPRIGAMIETPAAIFELEAILEQAEFVSVGTNDLTQYMLAVDRAATDAVGYYSILYPGVLRALHRLIEGCRDAGRPVAVCGEAAGNPLIAALLVGMGIRELSMSPMRAAAVRHVIRASSLADLEVLADQILRHRHVRETRELLDERIKPLLRTGPLGAGRSEE